MPAIAAASLFCGFIYLFKGDIVLAAVWLLMAALWYLNYRWSSQTPFIVLSEAGLNLRLSPLAPAKAINWHQVVNAQRSGPSRLTLYLTSGRKFSIYLVWIDAKDRKSLIHSVLSAVSEKGANAQEGGEE